MVAYEELRLEADQNHIALAGVLFCLAMYCGVSNHEYLDDAKKQSN